MSKKTAAAPAEEEWEDVAEEGEEEYEEEEEDTTIANSDVIMRYKKAAQWTNEVLLEVAGMCKPGASVKELCKAGDALMVTKVAQAFRGVDKGAAMPTCINVNSIVAHCNGTEGDVTINAGDLCKIDLGIQIDGYPVLAATTVIASDNGEVPADADAKKASAISAGWATMDAAVRQLRPGGTTADVSSIIEKCAAHFGLNPVEGVLSHQLKRYIIDGFKTIPCKHSSEHKVHEYNLEENTVWCLDLVLTTGKGMRLKEKDMKACLSKAAIDSQYEPKLQAAFEARGEIEKRFQYFPFSVAALENPKARLGLSELNKHGVMTPIPVLYEKDGDIVVHFKSTVLITPKKIEKVAGVPVQKGAPAPAGYADEELAKLAKLPISLKKKKAAE